MWGSSPPPFMTLLFTDGIEDGVGIRDIHIDDLVGEGQPRWLVVGEGGGENVVTEAAGCREQTHLPTPGTEDKKTWWRQAASSFPAVMMAVPLGVLEAMCSPRCRATAVTVSSRMRRSRRSERWST